MSFSPLVKQLRRSHSCQNPLAMMHGLYFGLEELVVCLSQKTHQHGNARRFSRSFTKSQVLFSWMECISDSITSCQFATSVVLIASLYVVGSPESIKNAPREYLSDNRDSLWDLRSKTGLVSSSMARMVGIPILLLDLHHLKYRPELY